MNMANEFDYIQHNEKLMAALGFDANDLDANKHGYLSKNQRKTLNRIRRLWKYTIALAIMATPIAIILAILDGYRIHDTTSSRIGICILIMIVAGGFSYNSYTKVQKFNKGLFKGDVLGISGRVTTHHFSKRGKSLHVGNQIFRTYEPYRFNWFIIGESYTIYYVPFSNYVLSAKLLKERELIPEIPKILKANPPII